MVNTWTTYIAGKDDYRRLDDSEEAQATKVFYANRERIERILNRERVDIEDTELLNYVIFQSILKNILKDLLDHRHRLSPAVIDNLLRNLKELDRHTDPASGKLDPESAYSIKLALEYRFKNQKNLLESLLESGYYDIDDTSETNAEHISTLMVQSGVAIPSATAMANMRLVGLSKSFVSYDGTPHMGFRDDVRDFAKRIVEMKGVNARLGGGETMFQLLLSHAADPRNADAANRCLDILAHEIAPTEHGGMYSDPDLPGYDGLTSERIIEQKFEILKNHPENFSIQTLERYRKSAYGWLDYARKVKSHVIEYHRNEASKNARPANPEFERVYPKGVKRERKSYGEY